MIGTAIWAVGWPMVVFYLVEHTSAEVTEGHIHLFLSLWFLGIVAFGLLEVFAV